MKLRISTALLDINGEMVLRGGGESGGFYGGGSRGFEMSVGSSVGSHDPFGSGVVVLG